MYLRGLLRGASLRDDAGTCLYGEQVLAIFDDLGGPSMSWALVSMSWQSMLRQ